MTRGGLFVAVALLGFEGCSGPSSSPDPRPARAPDGHGLAIALSNADSAFGSPVFQSFRTLDSVAMSALVPDTSTRPASLVFPAGYSMQPRSHPLLPHEVCGKTYRWDPIRMRYVFESRTGPANGLRLLMYEVDSSTGFPRAPLHTTGYAEVTDLGTADTVALGVKLAGASRGSGSYVLVLDPGAQYRQLMKGYVSSGGHRTDFDLDLAVHLAGPEMDANLSGSMLVDSVSQATMDVLLMLVPGGAFFTQEYRVHHGGHTTYLTGTDGLRRLGVRLERTINLAVVVDGALYATMAGADTFETTRGIPPAQVRFELADGTRPDSADEAWLRALVRAPNRAVARAEELAGVLR